MRRVTMLLRSRPCNKVAVTVRNLLRLSFMRFDPARITNEMTGAEIDVYVPVGLDSYRVRTNMAEFDIGMERRLLFAPVIDKVVSFYRDRENRKRLGQDCAAFALACAAGRSLYGMDFNPGQNSARAHYLP